MGISICYLDSRASFFIFFRKAGAAEIEATGEGMPTRSSFGSRLSFDFREKEFMLLVDELNHMIDAFEENNRQAKQMEENVKLSIAGLSHDLRTPLTSINGYVQLLHETKMKRRGRTTRGLSNNLSNV